ncbi:MAG: hypothetical protein ACR2FO_03630 [Actinomycetota bacterium]
MENSRIWVEAWSPEYGSSVEAQKLPESEEAVDTTVETAQWAPIGPQPLEWPRSAFLDGVHRVDARITIETQTSMAGGLLASVGVGAVIVAGHTGELKGGDLKRAQFGPSVVSRAAIAGGGQQAVISPISPAVNYSSRSVPGATINDLMQSLQTLRQEHELEMARSLASQGYLVIADGPLLGRRGHELIVGLIKSHQRTYLAPEVEPVIGDLGAGQRTPVFCFGQIRPRYSWYIRLAEAPDQHRWSGIVRCECSATLSLEQAVRLADVTSGHLPRFASKGFWDTRAPQNLVPIATLERRLWHLMGDREMLYRQIRSALR